MGDGFCISAQKNDELTSSYKNQARATYECENSLLQFNTNKPNLNNYIDFTTLDEEGYLTCKDGNKPKEKSKITQTMKIGANAINEGKSMISGLLHDINDINDLE
jgi:hypothetical protein